MLRSKYGQARFGGVEITGLVGVEGFHRDIGRRQQRTQRGERLQRVSDPEPRTLGCVLGACWSSARFTTNGLAKLERCFRTVRWGATARMHRRKVRQETGSLGSPLREVQ